MDGGGVVSTKLPSELLTREDIDRLNGMFASGGGSISPPGGRTHHHPHQQRRHQIRQHHHYRYPGSNHRHHHRHHRQHRHRQQQQQNEERQEEQEAPEQRPSATPAGARALLCPVISKYFYNVRTSHVNPELIKHDESFMGYRPTVSTRFPEAAAMIYHTLTVGQDAASDVYLSNFGHCNYVSSRHAVIFFSEELEQYELLNYSCHGTFINDTLYANDEQIGESQHARHRRKRKLFVSPTKKHAITAKMVAIDRQPRMQCSCTSAHFELPNSAWEGSIVIEHGSVLRFGCISFVFSLVSK